MVDINTLNTEMPQVLDEREILNFREARLAIHAGNKKQFPQEGVPEVIFAGKSNVGKSSLINLLTGKKNLARTASTPGKTRQVLFYSIDEQLYFVDVPGYGYAAGGKAGKQEFSQLTDDYFRLSQAKALILLLIDCRHKLSQDDRQMLVWLAELGVPFTVVLTKIDKLKTQALNKQYKNLSVEIEELVGRSLKPLKTSATERKGIQELRCLIAEHLGKVAKIND